jgi:hypothetical protein
MKLILQPSSRDIALQAGGIASATEIAIVFSTPVLLPLKSAPSINFGWA